MGICTERTAKCKVDDLCSGPLIHKASHFFVESSDIMHRWKIRAACFQAWPYLCLFPFDFWPHSFCSLNCVGDVRIEAPVVALHIPC